MPARIALIHAVAVAIPPVSAAFKEFWPMAEQMNLLDDTLSVDRERDGDLTRTMSDRIAALARYAVASRANGILYTCSAFGPAIEEAAVDSPIPVLKPNEAMFEAAIGAGTRIGMLATFAPSVPSMEEEFAALASEKAPGARLETICVPEAMSALKGGDVETHDRLLAEAAPRFYGYDAVLLAHFSTSRAKDRVGAVLSCPVLTSPGSAVLKLRSMLT